MPDDAHLRFRLRESLKVDFHNRNSRTRSHYWYHFSSFLIPHNFSKLVFSILNLSGFSKNSRNWAYASPIGFGIWKHESFSIFNQFFDQSLSSKIWALAGIQGQPDFQNFGAPAPVRDLNFMSVRFLIYPVLVIIFSRTRTEPLDLEPAGLSP